MTKRNMKIIAVVETELTDDALRALATAFTQDCVRSCAGRAAATAEGVPQAEADVVWRMIGAPSPAPGTSS